MKHEQFANPLPENKSDRDLPTNIKMMLLELWNDKRWDLCNHVEIDFPTKVEEMEYICYYEFFRKPILIYAVPDFPNCPEAMAYFKDEDGYPIEYKGNRND